MNLARVWIGSEKLDASVASDNDFLLLCAAKVAVDGLVDTRRWVERQVVKKHDGNREPFQISGDTRREMREVVCV